MKNKNKLTPANEDYLEAILVLEKNKKKVKSVEIARMLSVSQPGVNKAMNILKKGGLIEKDDYSGITLTEKGRAEAEKVYQRHLLINKFLRMLGVSAEVAERDCCKVEHVLSEETIRQIEAFCQKKTAKPSD